MLTKSQAVVLRTIRYNDTSVVAVLFTEAEGTVSFMVRIPITQRAGVKNKLFQPLTLLDIEWDHQSKRSMQRIRNCRCPVPYSSLPYEPAKATVALFLSEFLYYALRQERNGEPLFDYISRSLQWFDLRSEAYANFHLVFVMHLSRFLGLWPNVDRAPGGSDCFDMMNSCFTAVVPEHGHVLTGDEAAALPRLLRMNYETMHLFRFGRGERQRVLDVANLYYRLHVPGFPVLKSLAVLKEVFD
ncbi:MAG: recombination protein O N-terminal domain-containing protein [Bacteroidaceae bacterium]|nr:recombination protein O N-terminal domain-containing protein [Bacteroidaceae bacterium]